MLFRIFIYHVYMYSITYTTNTGISCFFSPPGALEQPLTVEALNENSHFGALVTSKISARRQRVESTKTTWLCGVYGVWVVPSILK